MKKILRKKSRKVPNSMFGIDKVKGQGYKSEEHEEFQRDTHDIEF